MAQLSIYKTLEKVCEIEDKAERVAALQKNGSPALVSVLKHMFDPQIKFLLPETDPPYKPLEFDEPGRLYVEARKLYLFVEGGHPSITPFKRESLFISLLENVNPEEAKLLLYMKNKKSPFRKLNKAIVLSAFPGLFQE